jgi:hypothetical protein
MSGDPMLRSACGSATNGREGDEKMMQQADRAVTPAGRIPVAHPIRPGVWRDLARLAAESFTIGLVVSVVLAVCVLMIAGSSRNVEREAARPSVGSFTQSAPIGEDHRGR